MDFQDNQFDLVIGSLVLSVVPNPDKCLEEMIRVVKLSGDILIFDKFVPKDKELSKLKKAIRPLVRLLGTDIGINFERLYNKNKKMIIIKEDKSLMFNGMYRKIMLKKNEEA